MSAEFAEIIHKLISERGRNVANNLAILNGFLADYARGKFVQERRHFIEELKTKPFDEVIKKYPRHAPKPVSPPAPKPPPVSKPPAPPRPAPAPPQGGKPPDMNKLRAYKCREKAGECFGRKDYANAHHHANEAVQLEPHNAENYFLRGIAAAFFMGRAVALDDINRALYIDPKHTGALEWKKELEAVDEDDDDDDFDDDDDDDDDDFDDDFDDDDDDDDFDDDDDYDYYDDADYDDFEE